MLSFIALLVSHSCSTLIEGALSSVDHADVYQQHSVIYKLMFNGKILYYPSKNVNMTQL